jgi:hypothetical protein
MCVVVFGDIIVFGNVIVKLIGKVPNVWTTPSRNV